MGDKRSARNFQLPDYPGFGLSCAKDRFTLPPPQCQPGELCLRSTPFLGMKDRSRGACPALAPTWRVVPEVNTFPWYEGLVQGCQHMSSKVGLLALWVLGFVMENGFEHRDSHRASISQFTLLENRPFPGE